MKPKITRKQLFELTDIVNDKIIFFIVSIICAELNYGVEIK